MTFGELVISKNIINTARKPQAFKPGDEWPPGGPATAVGGPEEDLACSGHGTILDWSSYEASVAVPSRVDSEISETHFARQSSDPPETVAMRGGPSESVDHSGIKYSTRSCASPASDWAKHQRSPSGAALERGNKF